MRKKLIIAICALLPFQFQLDLNAQFYDFELDATLTSKFGQHKKGETIHIDGLFHQITPNSNGYFLEHYSLISGKDTIDISKTGEKFNFDCKTPDELWNSVTINTVIPNLIKNGAQTQLRYDMEEDALQYVQTIQSKGLELNDPYLESYIYSLICKIAPTTLIDGRPFSINILIQESPEMNAGMYPNGTLVINTGLLAALHSEDELVGILSHEIAHFVLDHSIQNINTAIARQKRAEFWAAMATVATAAAEVYASSQNDYYVPGAATVAVAISSTEIAARVVERLGMKYNNEQELEADRMAKQMLNILGYDENGLATALNRIQEIMSKERIKTMYFASYTHPALIKRISIAGKPATRSDNEFEKKISFAVNSTARMKYESRRFKQSLDYSTQNIQNGVAIADDYILRANSLLRTKDEKESNIEIKDLIAKARDIDPSNINLYKSDIIASLRLGAKEEAISLLNQYIEKMNELMSSSAELLSPDIINVTYNYVSSNKEWANNMISKLKGF